MTQMPTDPPTCQTLVNCSIKHGIFTQREVTFSWTATLHSVSLLLELSTHTSLDRYEDGTEVGSCVGDAGGVGSSTTTCGGRTAWLPQHIPTSTDEEMPEILHAFLREWSLHMRCRMREAALHQALPSLLHASEML